MHRANTQSELDAALSEPRTSGARIALVPTMGNLHAGHLSLVAQARRAADVVVVSIFVNPLQFGPNEDFDRYPRTLEADLSRLSAAGVDVVFTPDVATVYPGGYPPKVVLRMEGMVAEVLEGAHRPGHFDGVATVVNILFNRVRPHWAIFGQKDYQQLAVIRSMASTLGLPIEIESGPIVRDADGLALSSRNQFLDAERRRVAPELHRSLQALVGQLKEGRRDFGALESDAAERLGNVGFDVQYVSVRALDIGPPVVDRGDFVVLAAASLGQTRLIDNVVISTG